MSNLLEMPYYDEIARFWVGIPMEREAAIDVSIHPVAVSFFVFRQVYQIVIFGSNFGCKNDEKHGDIYRDRKVIYDRIVK